MYTKSTASWILQRSYFPVIPTSSVGYHIVSCPRSTETQILTAHDYNTVVSPLPNFRQPNNWRFDSQGPRTMSIYGERYSFGFITITELRDIQLLYIVETRKEPM